LYKIYDRYRYREVLNIDEKASDRPAESEMRAVGLAYKLNMKEKYNKNMKKPLKQGLFCVNINALRSVKTQ